MFFIRRLLVAFATIGWASTLILEIYTNVFSSLLLLKFYIESYPMESRHQNYFEIFNEIFTLFSHYLLIIFTDFVSVESRYDFGFTAIYLILIVGAINIVGVILNLISGVR